MPLGSRVAVCSHSRRRVSGYCEIPLPHLYMRRRLRSFGLKPRRSVCPKCMRDHLNCGVMTGQSPKRPNADVIDSRVLCFFMFQFRFEPVPPKVRPAAVRQSRATKLIATASRLIEHSISLCHCRMESKTHNTGVEASAYRSMTHKRTPGNFSGPFYGFSMRNLMQNRATLRPTPGLTMTPIEWASSTSS